MSVNLMSAIFKTEMRDLEYEKDGEKRKTKASTAKLVLLALADCANDYGESIYLGYDKLEIKTALSRQGLADTLEALKQNGLLLIEVRGSKFNTNNYTINIRSFPPMFKEAAELPEVVKPLDSGLSSHLTQASQATGLDSSVNHQLTKRGDLIDGMLEMANFPGAKKQTRIDAIQGIIGQTLHVNSETKRWRDFAKFAEERQRLHGEGIEAFFKWLKSQPGFDLQYWPPDKMMEHWPRAFVQEKPEPPRKITRYDPEEEKQFVPPPGPKPLIPGVTR